MSVTNTLTTDANVSDRVEILKIVEVLSRNKADRGEVLTLLVTDGSMYSCRFLVMTIKSACKVLSFCNRNRTYLAVVQSCNNFTWLSSNKGCLVEKLTIRGLEEFAQA